MFANLNQNPLPSMFLEATIDLQVNLLPAGDELEDDSLIKALLEHVERQDSSSSPRPAQTTVNQFRSFADVTTRGIIFHFDLKIIFLFQWSPFPLYYSIRKIPCQNHYLILRMKMTVSL